MARGNTGNGVSGDLFFVSIKGAKKGEEVHFKLKKGTGDGAEESTEKNLSGILTKAEHRLWTYEGQTNDSVVLFLKDRHAGTTGETYKLELNMSSLTRGLINSLLSAKDFSEPLFLGVYTNKKGYASMSIGLGVDSGGAPIRLDWAYELDFLNGKITKETKKAKDDKGKLITTEVNNYLELNEFLLSEFKAKVIPLVASTPAVEPDGVADQSWPEGKEAPKEQTGHPTDDLPF